MAETQAAKGLNVCVSQVPPQGFFMASSRSGGMRQIRGTPRENGFGHRAHCTMAVTRNEDIIKIASCCQAWQQNAHDSWRIA